MAEQKWLLGYLKRDRAGESRPVYVRDFSWDCGWYWGGGYIGNSQFHAHFDGAFLGRPDTRGHCLGSFYDPWTKLPDYVPKDKASIMRNGAAVWEDLGFFLDSPQYTPSEWWRIKDLFKQFYALRDAAEVFQHGGHCTSQGRTDAEINKAMADQINAHIGNVIIPEIRKALNHGN